MEGILDFYTLIAYVFGLPMLVFALFFIPNFIDVQIRRKKARENHKNSSLITGTVIHKSEENEVFAHEYGGNYTITHHFFEVNFYIEKEEKRCNFKITETENGHYIPYNPNNNQFSAFYNHLTKEIIPIEQMKEALNETSTIFQITRFFVFIMAFYAIAALIGAIFGWFRALFE